MTGNEQKVHFFINLVVKTWKGCIIAWKDKNWGKFCFKHINKLRAREVEIQDKEGITFWRS